MKIILLISFFVFLFGLFCIAIKCIPKKDRKFLYLLLLFSVLLKIMAYFAFNIFLFNGELYFPDAITYDSQGWDYAQQIKNNDWSFFQFNIGTNYSYFVALIYRIWGHFVSLPELLNMFLGSIAVIPVFYIACKISNRNAAKISSILVAVYPSFIFWSIQIAKDALVILLTLAVLCAISRKNKLNFWDNLYLLLFLFLIASVRIYIAIFLAWSIILYLFVLPNIKKRFAAVGQTIIMIMLLFLVLNFGFIGENYIKNEIKFQKKYYEKEQNEVKNLSLIGNLDIIRKNQAHGNTAFFTEYRFNKVIDLIKYIPTGFIYYHFAPFSFEKKNLVSLPEMILLYSLIPFIIYGLIHTIRKNFRKSFAVLSFWFLLSFFYIVINSNVGTILRWRMQTYIFLFMFAGAGINLFFNKKSHSMNLPLE